jgi:hypothetical protein
MTTFPDRLEEGAKAIAAVIRAAPADVQATTRPAILAWARWLDATDDAIIRQMAVRVAGGFLGPLVAGGIKTGARALVDQFAKDATGP